MRMKRIMRRGEIIKAGISAFCKKGYHRTTVKDIIKIASISRGSFYLYFSNKKQVLNEIIDEFMKQVVSNFMDINYDALKTFNDFKEHILKVSKRFTDVITNNMEVTRLFLKEAQGTEKEIDEKFQLYISNLMDISIRFLEFCMERKIIRKVNPVIISAIAIGMGREILYQYTSGRLNISPDELSLQAAEFYWRALNPNYNER